MRWGGNRLRFSPGQQFLGFRDFREDAQERQEQFEIKGRCPIPQRHGCFPDGLFPEVGVRPDLEAKGP
jgi:hypothetical protein